MMGMAELRVRAKTSISRRFPASESSVREPAKSAAPEEGLKEKSPQRRNIPDDISSNGRSGPRRRRFRALLVRCQLAATVINHRRLRLGIV